MQRIIVEYRALAAVILVLAIFCIAALSSLPSASGSGYLTVAFLDVGQGDAIYIEAPNGAQAIIDSGAQRGVLSELGRLTGFSDRSIDVVIGTHSDTDHIGAFPDILSRYSAEVYIDTGVTDDGAAFRALAAAVASAGTRHLTARAGMRITLDGDAGVYIDILFPDRDISSHELDPNTSSIVARLTYGATSFLFTGDAPSAIEEYLVERDPSALDVDVLKLGHHGSRTSSSPTFLDAVTPETAVVSAATDNSYGHPHAEVVDELSSRGVSVRSTMTEGTIVFRSDGVRILPARP